MLTRAHRILIGVVVTGAVIIASIGFAGSYSAVRDLAAEKGFGSFASVFPIGIDAGICVLLALDLLLTWIRIPFPLLRQTAWLLTAATVAFNGAAAWPDLLGVGMHAVIPILFIVAVEAARHAIGRIADITADKHMEGVRLTRWILSPVPTFLLWRRMKLWELRSYEEVITLERERLVYQASLRSRFGRAWRRKAPAQALMPLRLARFGVPLAETAPAGLAAAGIEAPILFTLERVPDRPEGPALEAAADRAHEVAEADEVEPGAVQAPAAAPERPPGLQDSTEDAAERFAGAYQEFIAQFPAEPTTAQWALWLRDQYGISTGAGEPLFEEQLQPLLQVLKKRYALPGVETAAVEEPRPAGQSWYDYFYSAWRSYEQERGAFPDAAALAAYVDERDTITGDGGRPITGEDLTGFVVSFKEREFGTTEPPAEDAADPVEQEADEPLPQRADPLSATAGAPAQAAKEMRGPRVDAPIDEPPQPLAGGGDLTAPDRYYLAWMEYQDQDQEGREPSDEQLSAYCAGKGLLGRGGKPISPANLRRHFVRWRVYNVWAEQRVRTDAPETSDVAQACADRGITAQYNRPITPAYIAEGSEDFERRWQALRRHTGTQP
ncbi:DUF2637 domain-containing protein [Streptomyces sp. NPDC051219]|uniref:DUF2637 domain-containing protein n=1 Tax=Streptomyces sp. NPDC051219 TaxID=3155283 RepID=UPI00343F902A